MLGSTLAAALAQLPAGAQQQQLEQDLLNHLAGNYNLMLDPSSTDSNNLAVQFIKLAREAHDASTSAQFFEHGCQRTVSIQTQPHNDYPPFYAFKIGTKQHEYHQQQQQFMIVDQDTHVAYFNFADLPSSSKISTLIDVVYSFILFFCQYYFIYFRIRNDGRRIETGRYPEISYTKLL